MSGIVALVRLEEAAPQILMQGAAGIAASAIRAGPRTANRKSAMPTTNWYEEGNPALAPACHLDHPVYDCPYLALALREAAVLLTAHQKLMNLALEVLP
jgi:hypothetical protein